MDCIACNHFLVETAQWTVHTLFRTPNSEIWVYSSFVVLLDPGIKPWRSGRMEGLYVPSVTLHKCLCPPVCILALVESSDFQFLPLLFAYQPNECVLASSPLLIWISSGKGHQIVVKSFFVFVLLDPSAVFDTLIYSLFWKSLLFSMTTLLAILFSLW